MCFVLCAGQDLQAQAAPPSPAGTPSLDSTNDLSVTVGKTVLVDCAQPIARVAMGMADIAQATAVSPTEIMVNGRAPGETSLIIWDIHGGRQFFNVTVRPMTTPLANDSLDAVRRELRTELPGQTLRVNLDNNSVFLRGEVRDLTSSDRAVKIAATAGKVVNLLNVDVPASEPQILLKVRFASVDRSLEKQMGINLFDLGAANAVGGVSTGEYSPPSFAIPPLPSSASLASSIASAAFSNDLNILAFIPGIDLGATIQALESKGLVETLAEPNVMATDGREASFLAGGEYPYPVVQGTAVGGSTAVTIEFKEYGIRLNFIPTITPRGTIRLQVAPEVSALDFTNAVEISGFEVPAITSRRVNTEVELKDGQSFMIGGLMDNTETETFEKIPFLGDIPILGKFFQSMTRTKNNTELIVIVTPELVAPIPAGQPLPSLKYPVAFLPPNTNIPMHQPDAKTPENTPPPTPTSIPVETLIESMRPEKPLIIESTSGGFGTSATPINPATGATVAAPTAAAPQ
ncbi:MAG: pilus assembly protein N-terminal domain-containing protein [Terracidiphilus sp.]